MSRLQPTKICVDWRLNLQPPLYTRSPVIEGDDDALTTKKEAELDIKD